MGWSENPGGGGGRVRLAEAWARGAALDRLGYRGRVNPDGEPLDGSGSMPRSFSAGAARRYGADDRRAFYEAQDSDDIRDLAVDRAEVAGGFAIGDPGDSRDDPWPLGYRWGRNRGWRR
jgi:hypothetical protein